MTRDEVVALVLVVSFAVWVTVHLLLVVAIASHRPRWRALVALVVAPMAPYWGAKHGKWAQTTTWTASLVAYLVARHLADR